MPTTVVVEIKESVNDVEFSGPLTQAVLLKRYKRYLAEVVADNKEHRIIYCPNLGAMTGCDVLGSRIWFSYAPNTLRKYPETWELVEVDAGYLVCVNTHNDVPLVIEGIQDGTIQELQGYQQMTCNPQLLGEYSLSLLLEAKADGTACYLDVKSVTLGDEIHRGFFPDAPTAHSVAQLKLLIHAREQGYRAVLLYCVQHMGIDRVFPADHIDSEYGRTLRKAIIAGVEILAYRVDISLHNIKLVKPVDVCIPARMICSSRF